MKILIHPLENIPYERGIVAQLTERTQDSLTISVTCYDEYFSTPDTVREFGV